jgi:uncharacterized protein YjbI with pentapeptide repeats
MTMPETLQKITQHDLQNIIYRHGNYNRGEPDGARAVLHYKDLSGLNFKASDLSFADFTGSKLTEADLSGGLFENTIFFGCDLRKANLRDSRCAKADFRGANIVGANLHNADLSAADMRPGKLMRRGESGEIADQEHRPNPSGKTLFIGSRMTKVKLNQSRAKNADFSDTNMAGASVQHADLSDTNFTGATLSDSSFAGSNMAGSDLSFAEVSGAQIDQISQSNVTANNLLERQIPQRKISDLDHSLDALFEMHQLWLQTSGQKGTQMDINGVDLREKYNLKEYELTAVKAENAIFAGLDLSGAKLQSASCSFSDFRDCLLDDSDLRASSFKNAVFTRTSLKNVRLNALKFKKPDGSILLRRSDLSSASLRYCVIEDCDLQHCIMMGIDLTDTVLRNCNLMHADLTGAILNGAVFDNVNLGEAVIDMNAVTRM